ncbi:MAG TPA: DUF3667 domain-containing protein [Woeseiaceae bacterium]
MNEPAEQSPGNPQCLNCGATLLGQYCGNCGQRASSRLISIWELLRDAFGDLLDLDSRLWLTLKPLLIRPGRLTLDYLQGKRVRYMPPFRMYLVLSVVFFIIAFFDPQEELGLLFEPQPGATPAAEQTEEAAQEALAEATRRLDELEQQGVITAKQADAAKKKEVDVRFGATDSDEGRAFNFDIDEETGKCTLTGSENMPPWLQRRLTKERLEKTCERIGADEGKTLGRLMLDNIPIALIVLLPLMAFVLKALYPLSRRYFVEHLLFFIHFHSFFFLLLTLQILFARLADTTGIPEGLSITVLVAASFYVPVYLYKAMRLVYLQGHLLTMMKFMALAVAYFAGLTLTMIGALLFAVVAV